MDAETKRLARMVSRFAIAARAYQRSLEELDDERAGAHVRVLTGLYAAIVREGVAGQEAFLLLLESGEDEVAGMAAVYGLEGAPERCLAVLRRLAAEGGLLGFRARYAVELWEKGEWQQPGF
jgi:hypothetical protein